MTAKHQDDGGLIGILNERRAFMLWQRVVSACIFVPFLLISMFIGGIWWFAVDLLIICLALKEYRDLLQKKNVELPLALMCILSIVVLALQCFEDGLLSGFGMLLTCIALILWTFRKKAPFASFSFSVSGMILIAWSLSFLVNLRILNHTWWLVVLAFLIPWVTDTGAYAFGILFGKHKLAPVISPKKSWEGAIGGVLVCLLVLLLYNGLVLHYHWWFIVALAILGSVLGQLGDLLESWLKRWVDVKDSGHTIPGHGGILDRFDSMLFVSSVVYYALFIYQHFVC